MIPGPPPTPIEPVGRLPMLIPHLLNPPISGKGYPRIYPPISGIGYKKHLLFLVFSRNLPETTAKKYPFPEKMRMRVRPLMHLSGCPGNDCSQLLLKYQTKLPNVEFCLT